MTVYDTSFGIDLLDKIAGGKTPHNSKTPYPGNFQTYKISLLCMTTPNQKKSIICKHLRRRTTESEMSK